MSMISLHSQIRQQRFVSHLLAGLGRGWSEAIAARIAAWQRDREYLAVARRLAQETRMARGMAARYDATDPGFSADLRAAVALHERAALQR